MVKSSILERSSLEGSSDIDNGLEFVNVKLGDQTDRSKLQVNNFIRVKQLSEYQSLN